MLDGFQFPKTMMIWFEAHPATAAWMQAVIAGIAIVAIYIAATIPVRAEKNRLETERRVRAQGLALLLISETVTLKGEIETAIHSGNIYEPPIDVPVSIASKTDDLYILGETAGCFKWLGYCEALLHRPVDFKRRGRLTESRCRARLASDK